MALRKVRDYVRANHLALIALFVALGGVSYAAVNLPASSVGTKQLKKNAVVSSKVKNQSLRRADFAAGQLPSGATGPQGPTGASGSPDTPAQVLSKLVQVDGAGSGLDADQVDSHSAACPANTILYVGMCFDSASRIAAAWSAAADICGNAGGMLPPLDVLRNFANLPGVFLGSNLAEAHWTSNIADGDGNDLTAFVVQDSGGFQTVSDPTSANQPYRCAYLLVR